MPNNDYILRGDALKALSRGSGCGNICSHAIKRIPAADVEPKRKMGRWIAKKKNLTEGAAYMIPLTIRYFVCSLCGREEDNAESYCNCGAKMDAEPPKEGQTDE